MNIFRREAVNHQNDTVHGDIIIPASFGMVFTAIATIGLLVLIFSFLYFGQYTRKAHLSGLVMPSSGLIKVTPQYSGFVTHMEVTEGEHVSAGKPLYYISGERYNAQGAGTVGCDEYLPTSTVFHAFFSTGAGVA